MTENETEEADRVVDPERAARRAAEAIDRLARLEEFEVLRGAIQSHQRKMRASLSARLLSGEELAHLQRQADYDRGFVEGMWYPFKVAESATKRVEELNTTDEPEEVTDMWSRYG